MISSFVLQGVIYMLELMFAWLPSVSALPTIGGFDIDAALVSIFGVIHGIAEVLPPIGVILNAVIFYYTFLFLLLMISWIRWFFGFIRGAGS